MTKEDHLQIQVADYLRHQYPKLFWGHIPNGGSRNAIEGAKLKKMGTRAGMPDIMIFSTKIIENEPLRMSNGLAIELKIKPNKPTVFQLECLRQLECNRWTTAVCYSYEEAVKVINEYLTEKQ